MEIFIEPSNINTDNVKGFFTTRHIAADRSQINEILAKKHNITMNNVYMPVQNHTNRIHILESDPEPVVADAVITDKKHILIGIMVADCVPILLYDRKIKVIGAVHAGWKGTAGGVLLNSIKGMQERYGCNVEDILLAIGPSIRRCSYEVGENVKKAVQEATGEGDYYIHEDGRCFIDLSSANKIQALNNGILHENIWQSGECTFCNPDRFYSYRFSKGSAGRQGGFIGIW